MTATLALLSALVVGASDFLASLAARQARPEAVPLASGVASLVTITALVWAVSASSVRAVDLWWGAAAGAAGAVGFPLFLTAMARGTMSIVAPVTAVTGASTTVVVGVLRGDSPGGAAWVGIALAVMAIGVISAAPSPPSPTAAPSRGLVLAAMAGVGFGLYFVALSYTHTDAGLWPLLPAKVAAIAVLGAINVVRYGSYVLTGRARTLALVAGGLEGIASILVLVALRRGPLAVAGVLSSLYPVSTVLLAWIVLRERLIRLQWAGVAIALTAVVLIAT